MNAAPKQGSISTSERKESFRQRNAGVLTTLGVGTCFVGGAFLIGHQKGIQSVEIPHVMLAPGAEEVYVRRENRSIPYYRHHSDSIGTVYLPGERMVELGVDSARKALETKYLGPQTK